MEIKSLYDLWRNTSTAGKLVLILLFLIIVSPAYLQVIAPKVVADVQSFFAPEVQLGKIEHTAIEELRMMDTLQSRLPLNDDSLGTCSVVDIAEYKVGERVIVASLANWDVFEEDRYIQGTGGNGVVFLIGKERKSRLPFNAQEVLVAGIAPPYGDTEEWSGMLSAGALEDFIIQQPLRTGRSERFARSGRKSCEAATISFDYAFVRDGWVVSCRQDNPGSGPWTVLTCLSARGESYWTNAYWLPVESDISFEDMTNDGELDLRMSIAVWSGSMAHANRIMVERVLNLTGNLTAGAQVHSKSLVAHNLSQFERTCVSYKSDPYLDAMWLLILLDGATSSVWQMSDAQYASYFRSFTSRLDKLSGDELLVMLAFLTIGTPSYQPMAEEAMWLHDPEKEAALEDPWDRRWLSYSKALLPSLLAPPSDS